MTYATPPRPTAIPIHTSTHSRTATNRCGDTGTMSMRTSRLELTQVGLDIKVQHHFSLVTVPLKNRPDDPRMRRRNWPAR